MNQFPNLKEVSLQEAICWFTATVADMGKRENRISGKYSNEYKAALRQWKQQLHEKISREYKAVR